jgi:hypothetical protein
MDGSISRKIITYYMDNYVLDELVDSYIESGYFEQEPMVVKADGETFTVLEGNRRLVALTQLLGLPGYIEGTAIELATPSVRLKLAQIPCLVVESREEIASYLGFRHIGGLKPWPPEAKARFVSDEIERYAKRNSGGNPFAHVSRMIGTNAQSVRQSYFALGLLKYARSDLGIDVGYVLNHRFGVWQRCLSSSGVMSRLGAVIPQDQVDFKSAIIAVDSAWLARLIEDLTPTDGKLATLEDSRDVTAYGYIINSKPAYQVLRETRDLRAAEELVTAAVLAPKIESLARRVDILNREAQELEAYDELAHEAAKGLMNRARALAKTLAPDEPQAGV